MRKKIYQMRSFAIIGKLNTNMIIIKNAAKCLNCGEIVESTYRHDFVMCSCGNLAVDGGRDYLKRSVGKHGIKDMSPDVNLSTNVKIDGVEESIDIPISLSFFWPDL